MISFGVRQPEQPFFQNWVASIPQAQRQAQALPVIADAGEPVFSPAVRPGAGLVVRER
jgi:hypothetical protein